jgi:hypothetical protein
VFAEIVHLPEGRIGNVIARPVLRGHEIVYLGRSARRPIGSSRSTISWSRSPADASSCARRGWASRSCRALTNAHNYGMARNLSIYRFLCALQRQGAAGWASAGARSTGRRSCRASSPARSSCRSRAGG